MTAPLFFVDPDGLNGIGPSEMFVLAGDEARHAVVVLRIGAGEQVQIADGSGRVAQCTIVDTHVTSLALRIDEIVETNQPALRFVLMQALAKGDRDDQAIEAATELGVDAVIPWQAECSIVQWRGERGVKAHRKWAGVLRMAAKQSRRATVPELEAVVSGRMAVARLERAARVIVLHEVSTQHIGSIDLPNDGDVVVVVGPEGGVTSAELAAFEAVGGISTRLGPHVLRVSSAGPAALAILLADSRW